MGAGNKTYIFTILSIVVHASSNSRPTAVVEAVGAQSFAVRDGECSFEPLRHVR